MADYDYDDLRREALQRLSQARDRANLSQVTPDDEEALSQRSLARDLASAFAQASSQAGTLGGVQASAAPVTQYAQSAQKRDEADIARKQKGYDTAMAQQSKAVTDLGDIQKSQLESAKEQRELAQTEMLNRPIGVEQARLLKKSLGASGKSIDENKLASMTGKDFQNSPIYKNLLDLEEKKQLAYINAANERQLAQMKLASTEAKPDQFKVGGYSNRVRRANEVFDQLDQSGYKPESTPESFRRLGPVGFQSPQAQVFDQAKRDFVNAVLRRESGAAISSGEFASAEKQYFPQWGDSPQVLEQKRRNREQTMKSLEAEAGPALNKMEYIGPGITADRGSGVPAGSIQSNPFAEEDKRRNTKSVGAR